MPKVKKIYIYKERNARRKKKYIYKERNARRKKTKNF